MWYIVFLACCSNQPAALPPPIGLPWEPEGIMVATSEFRGYLVLPEHGDAPGIVLLVEQINPTIKSMADARAENGQVVLAIDQLSGVEQARDYVVQLPQSKYVSTVCLRPDCT